MKATDWNPWLKEHIKTCKTCDGAFNHMDESNEGMCEEAFKMFQQCMKAYNSNELTETESLELKKQLNTRKIIIKTLKTVLWTCVLVMIGFITFLIYSFYTNGLCLH